MKLKTVQMATKVAEQIEELKKALMLIRMPSFQLNFDAYPNGNFETALVRPQTASFNDMLSVAVQAEITHLENELRLLGVEA